MSNTHTINVQRREDEGKGASRRLRRSGLVPAVVYGGELKPVNIAIDHEALWLASQNDWFYASILDLSLNGDVQKVLLRDLQRHPYKQQLIHLDFQRVDENKALRTSVPLHFVNQEKSPAGKSADVAITHELTEVVVECLPKHLPESITVDLSDLAVGAVLHLSQIVLPEGVSVPELKLGKEHDVAVVIAKAGKGGEEEVAAPAAAEVPATKAKAEPKKK